MEKQMSLQEAIDWLSKITTNMQSAQEIMESTVKNINSLNRLQEDIIRQMRELANRFDDDGK